MIPGINCSLILQGQGVSLNEGPESTSAFLTSLKINVGTLVALVVLFSVLRRQYMFKEIYHSYRSYVDIKSNKYDKFKYHNDGTRKAVVLFCLRRCVSIFAWIKEVYTVKSEDIENLRGTDTAFFIKLIRYLAIYFTCWSALAFIILLPVYIKSGVAPTSDISAFSIGNMPDSSNLLTVRIIHSVYYYT